MLPIEQYHPIIVHFPIVFFLSLVALDGFALFSNTPLAGRGGVANLSAGLAALSGLTAIAAYSFGDDAAEVAVASGISEARLETHQNLGTITAIVLGLWAVIRAYVWWRQLPIGKTRAWSLVAIELAVSGLIIVTAYYGGQLVYEFGVNVATTAS